MTDARRRISAAALASWAAIWAFLVCRDLFYKETFSSYAALYRMPLEAKRAFVTGAELYGFIQFCKAALPARAGVAIEGIEDGSIERRRAVYYLYPLTESPDPDYILHFGPSRPSRAGYAVLAEAPGEGAILAREGPLR